MLRAPRLESVPMTEAATVELDAQYRAMREQAAIVDRPRFTAIAVSGPEAADYLQGQLSNDVEAMAPGEGRYAALLDRKGHLQGDLRVLLLAEGDYLLLAESEPGPALLRHLSTYKVGREVEVGDRGVGLPRAWVPSTPTASCRCGARAASRSRPTSASTCWPRRRSWRPRAPPCSTPEPSARARKLPRSSAWSRDAPASAAR